MEVAFEVHIMTLKDSTYLKGDWKPLSPELDKGVSNKKHY